MEGEKSSTERVLSGVPQGSVLGPLLFLIYVDEVTSITLSRGSKCNLFADDLLLFKVLSDACDFKAVQDDISAVEAWSTDNYLTLNPKKCKCMIISRKRDPPKPETPLVLSGSILAQVDTFKYLGVLLNNKLSWSPHVEAVCSKARKVLGLLYRRFYADCNPSTILQLYTALVRPHMEYACSVWAPYTARDIGALESVQKFACRMATHNWTSNYQELLSLTDLPTLERRRMELQLNHLFKIVYNLCYFPEGLVTVRECPRYNTRTTHSLTLHQPFAHTSNYFNSFLPHTVSLWNKLPEEIVFSTSLKSFKLQLRQFQQL